MDQKFREKLFKDLKLVLFLVIIVLAIMLAFKISIYLLPIIIGFLLSSIIEPLIRTSERKLKIPRKLASFLVIILLLLTVGFLIFLLISKLSSEIASIYHAFPKNFSERGFAEKGFSDTYANINDLLSRGGIFYDALPNEVRTSLESIMVSLTQTVRQWIFTVAKGLVNTAVSIPEAFIFTIVTILSTYFFSSDRENISLTIKEHLPESWMEKLKNVKDNLFSALIGYFRAEMIIMSITFSELLLGLSIIGVRYSLLLSITIAIIDIMPVLGTGSVLLPWAAYNLIIGNIRFAVSLLILYVIILIIRQIMEPKIVGQQIGLHPLITLSAMYAGLKIFGVVGMIFGPITILVLKNILSGVLKTGFLKEFLNRITPPKSNL
jgi:sporulation integral membrane protein YtvI